MSDVAGIVAASVAERLAELRARIAAAGGDLETVTIVAVTKTQPVAAIGAALAAGCRDVGENYADELIEKDEALGDAAARWHLIGGIQRRTLRRLAPHVTLFQSVDRLEEGEAIARYAPGAPVLVEVDTTGSPGREGVAPDAVPGLVEALVGLDLEVRGLMTVGPPKDPEGSRRAFAAVRSLVDSLGLSVVSMGMSEDFELAIAEGSTMVRIGKALFGPRSAAGTRPQ